MIPNIRYLTTFDKFTWSSSFLLLFLIVEWISISIFSLAIADRSLSLPGSPLGSDAYHEYQILLVQDYEELKKKNNQSSIHKNNKKPKENPIFEDEGWLQLTPVKLIPLNPNLFPVLKILMMEDLNWWLMFITSLWLYAPFSPKFFVIPSEGSISEAYLSGDQENSIISELTTSPIVAASLG